MNFPLTQISSGAFERRSYLNLVVHQARHPTLEEYIHSAVSSLRPFIQKMDQAKRMICLFGSRPARVSGNRIPLSPLSRQCPSEPCYCSCISNITVHRPNTQMPIRSRMTIRWTDDLAVLVFYWHLTNAFVTHFVLPNILSLYHTKMCSNHVVGRGLVRLAFVFCMLVAGAEFGYSFGRNGGNNSCDVSRGSWVVDKAYPLYYPTSCPFIGKEFNCLGNGRPDRGYLYYRWQPSGCNLPRFDGRDFLNKMRGKKLMFVGDSLSLNQWQSLTCLIHTAVPAAKYVLTREGGLSKFAFPEYNAEFLLSRNAFLVDIVKTPTGRALELDSISNAEFWAEANVLIFDSWHWWLHTGRKQPWDYIIDGGKVYKDIDRMVAYEKALTTWANWVNTAVDPAKTTIFFQGVSPDHSNATDWGNLPTTTCVGETAPIRGSTYPGGPHTAEVVLEKVLSKTKKPVRLLGVTTLSQLRKDGHPSFYGYGGHRAADCSHWCLPGVPDTWNVLLYAAML